MSYGSQPGRGRAQLAAITALAALLVGLTAVPAAASDTPYTTLTGTVLTQGVGAEAPTPAAGVRLQVIAKTDQSVPRYVTTNSKGQYFVSNLLPGSYFLWYAAPSSQDPIYTQASDGSTTKEKAAFTNFAAGTSLLDFTLKRGAKISGKFTTSNGNTVSGVSILVVNEAGDVVAFPSMLSSKWQTATLPAGTYKVRFSGYTSTPGAMATQWWRSKTTMSTATPIIVTPGVDAININGVYMTGAAISGSLYAIVDGVLAPITGNINVVTPEGDPVTTVRAEADGSWLASGLWSGNYKVYASAGADDAFTGYPSTYAAGDYGITSITEARSIRVDTGKETTGISIRPFKEGVVTILRPTISQTVRVGGTLAAATDVYPVGATKTYQWLLNGVAVPGATKFNFPLTSAAAGKTVTVRMSATFPGYAAAAPLTSAPTVKVATTATPKITGTAKVGSALTAVTGTWTAGTSFKFQWYANGVAITGATSPSFKPSTTHTGKRITVAVSGTLAGYQKITQKSAATLKVATSGVPKISGTAKVGSTLTVATGTKTTGTWTPGTSFKFQWYANGVAISKATSSSFKLTTAQLGKKITAKVTGSLSGYPTITVASGATAKVIR
ncbi:hypothetical protein [Leifsonia sp. Leaf264]|uniref:hypothetical protein n=1 Tax=Leifsonia sp. Leaf264 TaxID=1736314 RepID=UPI0006F36566|nr:hypothetical protein [Leifsonia sp. Leaf264]KQO98768.1 hypothetical protein ASF30_11950 [Leifsonia sp. Leaf264]